MSKLKVNIQSNQINLICNNVNFKSGNCGALYMDYMDFKSGNCARLKDENLRGRQAVKHLSSFVID